MSLSLYKTYCQDYNHPALQFNSLFTLVTCQTGWHHFGNVKNSASLMLSVLCYLLQSDKTLEWILLAIKGMQLCLGPTAHILHKICSSLTSARIQVCCKHFLSAPLWKRHWVKCHSLILVTFHRNHEIPDTTKVTETMQYWTQLVG